MELFVEAYDPTWVAIYKYVGMLLSVVGVFKTNFLTQTFFSMPLQAR